MNNQMEQSSYASKAAIVMLVVGLVVGSLGTFFATNARKSVGLLINSASSSTTVLISVKNQSARDQVTVSSLVVVDTSWVAVRENNNDFMGRILGAQKVATGTHEDVTIDLLRPTAPNVMYAVVIYKDDGDGVFDHTMDQMVVGETGEPVISRFVAE